MLQWRVFYSLPLNGLRTLRGFQENLQFFMITANTDDLTLKPPVYRNFNAYLRKTFFYLGVKGTIFSIFGKKKKLTTKKLLITFLRLICSVTYSSQSCNNIKSSTSFKIEFLKNNPIKICLQHQYLMLL